MGYARPDPPGRQAVRGNQPDGQKLPEIPTTIFELNEALTAPFTSAREIARIVNKSPSLASILLRIVNSSFYGFPSKIESTTQAVVLIGSKEISNLALEICTMQVFKDIPKEIVDMKSYIRHSVACGLLSRVIAAHLNIQQTDQMFTAGLLHDIGRLVIYRYFPDQAGTFSTMPVISMKKPIYHRENSLFTKEGALIPILQTAVRTIVGGQKCLIKSFVDIREQKEAEALRAEHNKLKAAVQISGTICH